MMKIIYLLLGSTLLTGCIDPFPYGSDAQISRPYNFEDSVRATHVYDCLQREVAVRGYLMDWQRADAVEGIDRYEVSRGGESVGNIEIDTTGKGKFVSVVLMTRKDATISRDLASATEECQKSVTR